jgi:DHA3 family macrolide efflux protein-like MFS transporter
MRWVTLFVTTCFLFLSAPAVLTTLMIQRTFGGETWMLATNEIFWFGGMMAAGSLITILSRRLGSTVRMIILGTLAAAVSTAAIGFSGGSIWLFFALGTINGITFTFVATPMTTYFQDNTPEDKLGRVFGVVGLVTTLAMPASLLIGGPLADRIPVEHVFVWGGVALFAVVGTFFAIPTARRSILKAMRPAPTSDVVHDDEATGATTGEGDDSGTSNAPEDVTLAA